MRAANFWADLLKNNSVEWRVIVGIVAFAVEGGITKTDKENSMKRIPDHRFSSRHPPTTSL